MLYWCIQTIFQAKDKEIGLNESMYKTAKLTFVIFWNISSYPIQNYGQSLHIVVKITVRKSINIYLIHSNFYCRCMCAIWQCLLQSRGGFFFKISIFQLMKIFIIHHRYKFFHLFFFSFFFLSISPMGISYSAVIPSNFVSSKPLLKQSCGLWTPNLIITTHWAVASLEFINL